MDEKHKWQNGFESYKQYLLATGTWKDGVRGTLRLDYRDLCDEFEAEE